VLETAIAAHSVELAGVSRSYQDHRGNCVAALQSVSLSTDPNEVLAVVGPSGCGKTTLLELICGLQRPDSGSLRCEPAVLMPQRDLLLAWMDALDNAALPLRLAGDRRGPARRQAAPLFAELGLSGFERSHPGELSGGMRQRVAFLRTLMSGKPVLCLDEPFGALDAITRQEMQVWLEQTLLRTPRTVVLVTHDVEEAILLADRVIVLSARPGQVIAHMQVSLPRPRSRDDMRLVTLRGQALATLGLQAQRNR
jgi:ABC-type nitrate/sulfonate/bicarbonate transport system ATPase subunit